MQGPYLFRAYWTARRILYSWLRPEFVSVAGVRMRIDPPLTDSVQNDLYSGHYEYNEFVGIHRNLAADDIVMELGTGLGFISTYCAKRIGSNRVFTYEANSALQPYLSDIYRRNGVAPELNFCVLGPKTGHMTFYLNKSFEGASLIPRLCDSPQITVPMREASAEIRRINPSFLIMDIEGGEFELIPHLDFCNVRKLSIELHEKVIGAKNVNAVIAILKEKGFRKVESCSIDDEWYLER